MDKQTELLRTVRTALMSDDFPTAIHSLEQVVVLAQERGDNGAAGRHLGNLALTYYRMDQPQKALDNFEQALNCARNEHDRMTENGLLGNMGNILREMGRLHEAEAHLNDALRIAQELGDTRGRGIWLSNLGLVYDDLKNYPEAIRLHRLSIKLARQINDIQATITRLGNLGNTYIEASNLTAALAAYTETLHLLQNMGRKHDIALRTSLIADIHAELGRELLPDDAAYTHFNKALDHYGHAMTGLREAGDLTNEADVVRSIGQVLADADQYEDAAQYFDVAEQMFEALGLKNQAARSHKTLTRIIEFLEKQGD